MKVPSAPVTINVLDVAGNLQLTKGMIENFKAAHPEIVSNVTYATATAPELAGKLQGPAAGRQRSDQPGADRHRRPVGGHQEQPPDQGHTRPSGHVPGPDGQLPRTRGRYAGSWRRATASRSSTTRRARSSSTTRPRSPLRRPHRRNCSPGRRRTPASSSTRARPTRAPAEPSSWPCRICSATRTHWTRPTAGPIRGPT